MEALASLVKLLSVLAGGIVACSIAMISIAFGFAYPITRIQEADDWTDVVGLVCFTLLTIGITILVHWAFNH